MSEPPNWLHSRRAFWRPWPPAAPASRSDRAAWTRGHRPRYRPRVRRERAAILARIVPPAFPARDFDITKFGARGDGRATSPSRFATRSRRAQGRRRTRRRPGRTIPHRRDPSAKRRQSARRRRRDARFSAGPARVSAGGVHALRRHGADELLAAHLRVRADENIAVTGQGTLDGQASETHWWPWKGGAAAARRPTQSRRAHPPRSSMVAQGVPVAERVFGDGAFPAAELHPAVSLPATCSSRA